MSRIAKEVLKVYSINGNRMSQNIKDIANKKFFKSRNIKKLIKLFPFLIEYTNKNNLGWLNGCKDLFLESEQLLDTVIESSNFFKTYLLSEGLTEFFESLNLDDDRAKRLVDKLLENFDGSWMAIDKIYLFVNNNWPELSEDVLRRLFNNSKNNYCVVFYLCENKLHLDWIYDNLSFVIENFRRDKDLFIKIYGFVKEEKPELVDLLFQEAFKNKNTSNIVYSYLCENKINAKLIYQNIDIIIENTKSIHLLEFFRLYHFLKESYSEQELKDIIVKMIKNQKSCLYIFECLCREKMYPDIIDSNIDFILEKDNDIDLFYLKKITGEYKEANKKIISRINVDKRNSVISLLKNQLFSNFKIDTDDVKRVETVLEVIYLIIEDICKNEKIDIADIDIIGSGSYSKVFVLGDKVIKVGNRRVTETFNNNPYIISSLLRKSFEINKNLSVFVEVQERVDTKSEISDEELYQLYKKVRQLGLIWFDVAKRNVGKLLKDNNFYWRQELPITDERLGLKEYKGNDKLKTGDFVILDNDLIVDEDDKDTIDSIVFRFDLPLYRRYEERYKKEKSLEMVNIDDNIDNLDFESVRSSKKK